jgi:hypothetical protein
MWTIPTCGLNKGHNQTIYHYVITVSAVLCFKQETFHKYNVIKNDWICWQQWKFEWFWYHCNLNAFPGVSFDRVDRRIWRLPWKGNSININISDITYFPVSANYETEKHQYFSIVSLPTDLVIVDHAVYLFLFYFYFFHLYFFLFHTLHFF